MPTVIWDNISKWSNIYSALRQYFEGFRDEVAFLHGSNELSLISSFICLLITKVQMEKLE